MTKKSEWRPLEFTELERRLTEAKSLLEQAARLMEARDLEKVHSIAEMHLQEEQARNGHPHRRRYR